MKMRLAALGFAAFGLMAMSPENAMPDFTLTARQGEYSESVVSALSYVAFKARVTVLELGPYGKWSSGVFASVRAGPRFASLKAFSRAEGLPLVVYAERGIDGQEEGGIAPFRAILDPALPFEVELRWTSDGHVCMSVTQSGQRESMLFPLGATPSQMKLGGSSGSFRFEVIEQSTMPAGADRESADKALKAGCAPIS